MHTSLTFTQALGLAESQALATLDVALHERLSAAVALVKDGRVFQTTAGQWQVDSSSTEGLTYSVNGQCSCHDFHFNKPPQGLCKHRLSRFLAQRVRSLMATPPAPVELPQEMEAYPDNDFEDAPQPPAPPPAPLPEAPVSITLKASLHGHEVLVTLRGTDFASVRTQVEEASAWLKAHAPTPPPVPTEGWCTVHNVAMKQTTKDGRSWYSHRTADGWCKGR